MDYLTTRTNLSPIRRVFGPGFVYYNKGCTRLAAASDKVYQLLAHGWWFSPCTPASTTKTGCHGIAESGIKHQKINQSINYIGCNGKIMLKSFDVHCGMKIQFCTSEGPVVYWIQVLGDQKLIYATIGNEIFFTR